MVAGFCSFQRFCHVGSDCGRNYVCDHLRFYIECATPAAIAIVASCICNCYERYAMLLRASLRPRWASGRIVKYDDAGDGIIAFQEAG